MGSFRDFFLLVRFSAVWISVQDVDEIAGLPGSHLQLSAMDRDETSRVFTLTPLFTATVIRH